jgi:hypothetical protein
VRICESKAHRRGERPPHFETRLSNGLYLLEQASNISEKSVFSAPVVCELVSAFGELPQDVMNKTESANNKVKNFFFITASLEKNTQKTGARPSLQLFTLLQV